MQRSGQLGEDGAPALRPRPEAPERRPRSAQTGAPRRRATPRQFLHEVNVEMRKVAWPTRSETINYSIIVLVAIVVLTAFIGLLDYAFGNFVLKLYNE